MPYFLIENYKAGLDVRKSILTAPAGTLTRLTNAAITPGGEIQKRRAFVKVANLAGSFGLANIGTTLIAFTKNTNPVCPLIKDPVTGASPTDVKLEYHKLPNESPSSILTDFDVFDGKVYVVLGDNTPAPPKNPETGPTLPAGVADGTTYLQTSDNVIYVWQQTAWAQWAAKKRVGLLPGRGYQGTTFRDLTHDKIYSINYQGDWELFKPRDKGPTKPADTTGYSSGDVFYEETTKNYYQCKPNKTWAPWYPDGSGPFLPSSQMEGYTVTQYNENKNYITRNQVWEEFKPDQTVATLPKTYKDGTPFLNTTDGNYYEWKTSGWTLWRGAAPKPNKGSGTTLPATGANNDVFELVGSDGKKVIHIWWAGAWTEWKLSPKLSNPHYYYDDRDKVKDQFIQNLDLTWEWTEKNNPNKGQYQETEGSGMGLYIRAYKSKLYAVGDKYLRFSAVDNAFLWEASTDSNDTTRTGAGYINVSLQEGGSSVLRGVEIYYDKLALMSELSTQIWSVVSDPKQNALGQVLRQTGTKAPWSVQQYGSGDILYLASSGIRSLKARNLSNSAAVSDIGSPIDDLIRAIPEFDRTMCRSVLEPIVGRVWFAFRRHIAVLSYFPGPDITAWCMYTTDFNIDYIVACGDRLFLRSGDDLYLFGGVDGNTYDNTPVEIRLPFHDGSKPGHMKQYQAIDATVWGQWDIKVAYNYDMPDAEEHVATVSNPTWMHGRHELTGYSSHMSLRFYNNTAEKAQIANSAIHYMMAGDSD
jgi:hypothetical protein